MKGLKPLTIGFRAILFGSLAMSSPHVVAIQIPSVKTKIDPMTVPDITVQSEDYAIARSHFHTDLVQKGPAPYQECTAEKTPAGITEIKYVSGSLELKAWISRPVGSEKSKSPAVLFLHGGFCFDSSEWKDSQPFRDAGFVVMTPVLRAENGQPGYYSQFYDEVEDVIGAAEYLRSQSFVDSSRLYVAGHSVGGTLTLLTSMSYSHFRAAASFSGSPDAVGYTRHTIAIGGDVPFDYRNPVELQLRSARVYAASFKCPVRIYYGADETHFALSSKPTADLAQAHHLNVQAVAVDGGHNGALNSEIEQAIEFFRQTSN